MCIRDRADTDTLYQIKSGNFMLIYYLIVWGLMACSILSSMIGLLVTCIMKVSAGLGNCCGGLMACSVCGSGLGAWIAGMVWRFNEAGKFASGDNLADDYVPADDTLLQLSNGKFMGIYYLITWIMLGTACGCSIIGGLVTLCCK